MSGALDDAAVCDVYKEIMLMVQTVLCSHLRAGLDVVHSLERRDIRIEASN